MTARYRDGARAIAPLIPAAFVFGASFGVLARAEGMGVLAPIVMSLTTFAGSAQFAVVSILGAGGGVAAAVTAAALLNARYAAIGISIASGFRGVLLRRFAESQLIVDEAWAVSIRGGFDRAVLIGAGLVLFVFWNLGTALGSLGGELFGDPERFGLDAAFPALFLALLVPLVGGRRPLLVAAIGALIALALLPFSSPGVPIIAGACACLIGVRR